MNNDLISREALKKKIQGVVENEMPIDKKWALGLRYALKLIDNAPTVSDEPVGTWIEENVEPDVVLSPHGHRWRCPVCNDWQTYGNPKHCPDCGARLNKCQEVIERMKRFDEELRRKWEQEKKEEAEE